MPCPHSPKNYRFQTQKVGKPVLLLSKQGKGELAAAAWDEVEELLAETSHQHAEAKTNFEQYCEDNPWARECRIYD